MRKIIPIITLAALCVSCTWVQLTSQGQGVRLATVSQTAGCTRVGTTTSTTREALWVAERGSEKVQNELVTLARNEAGSMGGNTIAPEGAIDEGKQRFTVYRCP